ncbi:reverse transcriptase domain-containing protein [Tanacetum coccineum]
MAEGEIDNLTMEQYLALTRGNQAPGVVKPEIGGNVNFEIKSQFMRELREDTFFRNKNDDAHEHVERVLDIISLFNLPGVSHDAVMLHVFPITLTGAAKRWVDRIPPRTVDSWDLLKKAFIQRYCPPSKTAKQLEEIRNFKPISGMTPAQALTTIQTMADHSQKWHDESSNRNIEISSNSEGIAAIVSKLDKLGRDMKKLKENVHGIQVGCQNYGGAHLDKDCPLKKEVKSVEEAKYSEFGRPSPFSNGAKYRVGSPGYYIRIDNRPPFGEKRPSLEELMNKHLEESSRRRAEMEEWQLTKEFHRKTASEVNNSPDQCKSFYTNKEAPLNNASPKVSSVCTKYSQNEGASSRILPCQLPPKELNPGNFTLPCTIGSLNFYAMADLGASVNVIPKSMFEHLKLAGLTKTDMLVEMVDTTKRTPIGIVENVLVKINKFLFPSDLVVMDMLNTHNETMILGRPFLATIHARIYVFNKEISLGIRDDKIAFDMDKKTHNFNSPIGDIYMIKSISDNKYTSYTTSDASSRFTTVQGNLNPRPKDYPFKDWLLTKVGHTNICEPVKKALLKTWLLDSFKEELVKDPRSRSFDDYKWMFDLEVNQLADEYELGIGKK